MGTTKTNFDELQPSASQERYTNMQTWLATAVAMPFDRIEPLAGDASFRRYFRALNDQSSYIIMDAPPHHENCLPFIEIAKMFKQHSINVPDIIAQDVTQGFLLLSDFGDQLYLKELNTSNAHQLYTTAFQELLKIQACDTAIYYDLPRFNDDLLRAECQLFIDWYLLKNRKIMLSHQEHQMLHTLFNDLIDTLTQQPQVCVHRDYHSRNLICYQHTDIGVLDFQDAVIGPITYDLASLLRDCYIAWPEQQITEWLHQYYFSLTDSQMLTQTSFENFMEWFDLAGLQRHLKCLGIFSRLNFRDQKSMYLNYIPQVIDYVKLVCQRHSKYRKLLDYLA